MPRDHLRKNTTGDPRQVPQYSHAVAVFVSDKTVGDWGYEENECACVQVRVAYVVRDMCRG